MRNIVLFILFLPFTLFAQYDFDYKLRGNVEINDAYILPVTGGTVGQRMVLDANGQLMFVDEYEVTGLNPDELLFGSATGTISQTNRASYTNAAGLRLEGTNNSNTASAFSMFNSDNNLLFRVFNGGTTRIGNVDFIGINSAGTEDPNPTTAKGLIFRSAASQFQAINFGSIVFDRTNTQNFGGTTQNYRFKQLFNPSAGGHNINNVTIDSEINQTGSASGDIVDFEINPTFTSLLGDYTALKINNGVNTGINVTGTGDNTFGGNIISNNIPAPPTSDGTYTLQVVVSGGGTVFNYSWQ